MRRVKITVLASGSGTNLGALIKAQRDGIIKDGIINLVVSDNESAYALNRAKEAGIKSIIIKEKRREEFEKKLLDVVNENKTDLVVLAGFMRILSKKFIDEFKGKIINIHPSLIPSFCGKGYYGINVHKAALKYKVKVSGATVHYVNEIPDGGEIIMQKPVCVKENDTPKSLQERILREAEWVILPLSVQTVCEDILKETNKLEEALEKNTYPGRGIIIGKSMDGENAFIAYFIMGRSKNSRNRIFEKYENKVRTKPSDPSKISDPSLIIYSPYIGMKDIDVITNGDQSDTIEEFINNGRTFEEALSTRTFEPDKPNYTPRISGICFYDFKNKDFSYKLSILKRATGGICTRQFFNYKGTKGIGHLIHTYKCDGNPLPKFQGEPIEIEIPNNAKDFANKIWNCLDDDNKISLFVRKVPLSGGEAEEIIINKNK